MRARARYPQATCKTSSTAIISIFPLYFVSNGHHGLSFFSNYLLSKILRNWSGGFEEYFGMLLLQENHLLFLFGSTLNLSQYHNFVSPLWIGTSVPFSVIDTLVNPNQYYIYL